MEKLPQLPRYAARVVWSSVLALVAVLVVGALWLLQDMRTSTREESEQRLTRFVQASQNALNRSMSAIDLLLAGVDDMLRLNGDPMSAQDPAYLQQVLQLAAKQNALISSIVVVKADGKVLAAADNLGNYRVVRIPQTWLQAVMQNPERERMLHISTPDESWAQVRTLHIARYLSSGQPGEHYLVVAQVPVSSWVGLLMQGTALKNLEVTLERADGSLVLRVPLEGNARLQADAPSLDRYLHQGVQQAASRLDGAPGLLEVVQLNYDQLRLTAALPMSAVLVHWYGTRDAVLVGVVVFSLLLLAGASLMQVYLRHMQRAQQRVMESEATLHRAMDSIAAGFLQLDDAMHVVHWNQRYAEMFPWQLTVLVRGCLWRDVLVSAGGSGGDAALHSEVIQLRRMLDAWQEGDESGNELATASGLTLQLSQRRTPDGGRVITCEDITAIRLASAEIETLAFYDPLTGLPNRRLLLDRLSQATHLAQRAGWLGALIFVDLNKFKVLNDTQGHEMGDLLLQEVGQRLRASIRASDTVARLGGDEFVIMLCDLPGDMDEAGKLTKKIAEKMLRRLADPYVLGSYVHRSSASLGVTLFGDTPVEVGELLKQADIAMYQIKTQQGTGVCFFEPHMQEVLSARARLEADLRYGIAHDQFVLHYQPQFMADGSIDGIEALVRWEHPEQGMVPPGQFIAVAEDSELIVQIGQWVLRTACQQLARWQNHPRLAGIHMAVNVSARQFRQQDFVSQVLRAIADSAIPSSLLKLELTETLVIDDMEDSIAKMSELRSAGVRFSMDDFGTGQSSLSYLTRLPLSQLKIDQSFVRHLGERHTDDVVAQTIIGMAHNLGLTVIAEGVELQSQLDSLVRFGCQRFQGYFFSRPLPAADLQRFVEQMPALQPSMLGRSVAPGPSRRMPVSAPGGDHNPAHDQGKSDPVVDMGQLGQHQGGEDGGEHRDQVGKEAGHGRTGT